jgi:CHAT domain-containing protein
LQREIALRHPVVEGEALPLERVQSVLSKQTAIIGWLDLEVRGEGYQSWCYAIRSSGPVTWARAGSPSSEGSSSSPFARARRFRDSIGSPASWNIGVARESQAMWRERIAPLEGALEGVEQLIVVPSGAMLGVPIEAIMDEDGMFLEERYSVSYVPSATIHTWLAERLGGTVMRGALLVGDPPYSSAHRAAMEREGDVLVAQAEKLPGAEMLRSALAGNDHALAALPRLRGTRDEVAAVAGVSEESHLLLGPEATEQELARMAESGELRKFGTIHVATHALVDDERPERSALVLSLVGLPDPLDAAVAGARIYDGLVTAKEIVREWDLNADLVTLSACETGLGKEIVGEGYVGLAHAFLQAGARSLLVTLWKVEDRATSLLICRFYENWLGKHGDERGQRLGERMSKAAALREAKLWLRGYTDARGDRPYEHPYYWSAFILIGGSG